MFLNCPLVAFKLSSCTKSEIFAKQFNSIFALYDEHDAIGLSGQQVSCITQHLYT